MEAQMTNAFVVGEKTEERFFKAIWNDPGRKPGWFIQLQRASPLLDVSGIDAVALVRYRGIYEPVRIPVQIKSSTWGRDMHYIKHPEAAAAKVVVIVVDHTCSDNEIRYMFYTSISKVRDEGVMYKQYFLRCLTRPLTKRGTEILEDIREHRRMLASGA